MPRIINVKGSIVPNDYAYFYDYFKQDYTCPKNVSNELSNANGEPIEVHINSPGGVIDVGSEIYTALRSYTGNLTIKIVGEACSAASVIAMAGYCEMSPTALMMVHRVSTRVSGNAGDMQHAAEMLSTADEALCSAYVAKSPKLSKEKALEMMEHETWLNAEQALEYGLIDKIMFTDSKPQYMTASGNDFKLPTKEAMDKVRQMIDNQRIEESANYRKAQSEMDFLKMKGVII